MDDDLRSGVAELGRWLRVAAWPTWLAHGVDRARGGFFEALSLDTKTCEADFRRLRVVARQIYVFSEAHRAGLAGAAEAVRIGLRFLERHAVHPEGGYAWRFDLDHRAIDLTRDLYDHAFVLLALSSATAIVPADILRPEALHLLDWIERAFPHPHGGYLESLPHAVPRRQNPHMHLLEAFLAAHGAFGGQRFMDCAHRLVDVFARRLFDQEAGALPEYFDEALQPVRKNGVFLVEPGHHCEWVWLLHCYQEAAGQRADVLEISRRLMAFVDGFGIDHLHGGLFDVVDSKGEVVEAGARLWPQAERLKAEFVRPDPEAAKRRQALAGLRGFLRPDGLWHERRDRSGRFAGEPAPASSLYHVTSAILAVEPLFYAGGRA
jgi:mannose-6-phosphate isomerase